MTDNLTTRMPASPSSPEQPGATPGLGPATWQVRLWQALRHQARVGLLVGIALFLVVGAITFDVAVTGKKAYTSTTVMLIDDPLELATAGDQGQLLKLIQLRGKYQELAQTVVIAQPVASVLHLPTGVVLSDVAVVGQATSLLLDVVATTPTPGLARELSQGVANELTLYVENEERTYNVPAQNRFTLRTVSAASPAVGHGPKKRSALTLALGLAVVAFVVGFVLTQLARNRRFLR